MNRVAMTEHEAARAAAAARHILESRLPSWLRYHDLTHTTELVVPAAELLAEAVQLVQNLDPVGVATRSLRECLLVQIEAQRREFQLQAVRHRAHAHAENNGGESEAAHALGLHEDKLQVFSLATRIVDQHLLLLQKRDMREMGKALSAQPEAIQPP